MKVVIVQCGTFIINFKMLINQSNIYIAPQEPSLNNHYRCKKHGDHVIKICTCHFCDHYKEMCQICIEEDIHHEKYHLTWRAAVQEAIKLGKVTITGLQGVRARKNQQMEQNIINNPGLFQLQQKLDELSIYLNKKIQSFRSNIKKIYSNHIKEKLDQLDQIIEKSQQLLQRQIKKLQEEQYKNLNIFFQHDFLYDLKYYESYFNEIFVKKIRSFKTAIDNDRIFSLITHFQQNLVKIFSFDKQIKHQNKIYQYHCFNNQQGQCYLYYYKDKDNGKNVKQLIQKPIAAMNRISHSKLLHDHEYKWIGSPQSIFYPYKNCYYILGQGDKPSRIIVKYDHINQTNQIFTLVKSMETQRKNFSVCMLKGQIYIIGGENQKDGCLDRCQKFVPMYNNQVYLIHSLRQKSSQHSVTTYKNKYILKFGGIKKLTDHSDPLNHSLLRKNNQDQLGKKVHDAIEEDMNYSSPELYSLETEQWSIIPFNTDNKLKFHLSPTIIKLQTQNYFLILGGDPRLKQKMKYRPAYQISLDENKGQIEQIKVRTYQSKIRFDERIHNSTIMIEQDQQSCSFLRSRGKQEFKLGRYKLET